MKVICEYKNECTIKSYCSHREPHKIVICRDEGLISDCSKTPCYLIKEYAGRNIYCIDINNGIFNSEIERILEI